MKVKVIKNYYDTKLQANMTAGKDILENVSEERANQLVAAGVGELLEAKEKKVETAKVDDKEEKKETAKLIETKIKKSITKK